MVAVELLPDVVRWHAIGAVTGGFALGIGVMFLLRHITELGEVPPGADGERERSATGMLVAIGVDVLLGGIARGGA